MNLKSNHDSDADRFEELSPGEAADLETLLGGFRPRSPQFDAFKLHSTLPGKRSTNPWTLAATWFSGAIVGALLISLIGKQHELPQQPSTPLQEVAQETEIADSFVDYENEPIDRLLTAPWDDPAGLSAGSHFAFQTKRANRSVPLRSDDIPAFNTNIDIDDVPRATRRTTHQELLQEFLRSPGHVL